MKIEPGYYRTRYTKDRHRCMAVTAKMAEEALAEIDK